MDIKLTRFEGEPGNRTAERTSREMANQELTDEMVRVLAIAVRDGGWVSAGTGAYKGHVERVSAATIRALVRRGLLVACLSNEGGVAGRIPAR